MDVPAGGSRSRPDGSLLLVDDEDAFRRGLARLLADEGYTCVEAGSVADARTVLTTRDDVVLVLCDVNLPGGSGIELLAQVRREHRDVAVVMVTGVDEPELADAAFELGAAGYLTKPFETNEIVIAIHGALVRRRLEIEHREQLRTLERTIARTRQVRDVVLDVGTREAAGEEDVLERLSRAVTVRDEETGRHIARVGRSASVLAQHLGFDAFTAGELETAAALHDVGKIGVPDSVLLKPGPLGPEERTAMQQHPLIGYQLLAHGASPLVGAAADIALNHHEWWDGGGYPRGLAGEEIPEVARIVAVADVFDALTSDRVYRPGLGLERALGIIDELEGRQFEPRLVRALHEVIDDVLAIRAELPDRAAESRIRVLVVDDHTLIVQSLRALLETAVDIKLVGTAGSVQSAVDAAAAYDPDVVLMDFELPDGDGVMATELVKAHRPGTRVILLTGRTDDEALVRALSAGCAGFVLKTSMSDRLVEAVRAAYRGEEVNPRSEVARLLGALRPTSRGLGASLRPRDLQVLELLANGASDVEIAGTLGLHPPKVRQEVDELLVALHATSRLEAVVTGVREGLVPGDLVAVP